MHTPENSLRRLSNMTNNQSLPAAAAHCYEAAAAAAAAAAADPAGRG